MYYIMTKLSMEIIDKILIYLNDRETAISLKRKYVLIRIDTHSFSQFIYPTIRIGPLKPSGYINCTF
jgi:hypothetical protein